MADPATVTEKPQPGDSDADFAAKWIAELDRAENDKGRQRWLKRARNILKLYRRDEDTTTEKRRFALFWSNIQTLSPAVYARTPTAVVTRRFKDSDPVGRVSSEILERALNFSLDAYDFANVMNGVRDAYLLIASGQVWVRYVPHFKPAPKAEGAPPENEAPDGQVSNPPAPEEVVEWEDARADLVNFEDFGHSVARNWAEVRFVWRRVFMTRDELVKRFGKEIGKAVPLDWASTPGGVENDPKQDADKAAVYEIADKTSGDFIWISKGYPTAPLDRRPDPLGLCEFFPCPRPALGTITPDSIVPVPDFAYYEAQCKEIDKLTIRIDELLDALKVVGFYASSEKTALDNLLSSKNGTLIPVDSWAALQDKGGVKGIVEWFPVEQVVGVLKGCFDARKQIIDDVYQVTGISDIMRGDTDPDETAKAQSIKATWGSSRVRDRQKELSRFARDVLRLKSEIIATKFSAETLSAMTGVQLLTGEQKAQAQQAMAAWQQAAQQAQAAQQPPPPNPVPPQVQQMLSKPSWDDVMGLLKNNVTRAYHVDVETDSTIEPNDQEEKQRRIEFVTAVGKYLAESLPVVQASPAILPVIAEGLKFLVRGFRVGREMEDTIERALDALQAAAGPGAPQQSPKGPDPQAEQVKAQASLISAQADQAHVQVEGFRAQSEHQLGMAQVDAENQRTKAQLVGDIHATIAKAAERQAVREINSTAPMVAPTR